MATKSEIREAKKSIAYRVNEIDLAQIGLAQSKSNWKSYATILGAFADMKDALSILKTHIIDNDDYTLAIELKDLIKPFLGRFSAELIDGEDDLSMAINQQIFELDSVWGDLQDWISEYEKQPHETQQVEQTQHHETKEARNKKNNISPKVNIEELKKHFNAKFKGAGANIDYFSTMVSDIEGLCTIKDCMAVALMIYNNENYFIAAFNTFSDWCKRFFECIGIEVQEGFNFSRKYKPAENIKKVFTYLM